MAAYASVVSLTYIINQIQHHHNPPISLQKSQLESLTKNPTFLQNFFEQNPLHFGYTKQPNPLDMLIQDAAYKAEDIIESHIVDQIHIGSTNRPKRISSVGFFEDLEKVIDEMDSITKEVVKIKESNISRPPEILTPRSLENRNPIVGFDDVKNEVMDQLIGGELDRQVIPIVGMAGIDKTTLAKYIYQDKVVEGNFDILAWATVTQRYRNGEVLSQLLHKGGDGEGLREEEEYELKERLYQRLSGRRYLVVMDDIWDVKVWEGLRRYFPDNQNGSRIVLTTRISNFELSGSSYVLKMGFLDKDDSWALFSKIVFGEERNCSLEMKEIGKEIVGNCRGLPLSIVVAAGLLARCEYTQEYWEKVAENLNSIVNSEDDEHCLRVLHMSYTQLPVHLKPCFLYMGVRFRELEYTLE